MITNRREFLRGAGAVLLTPAIVKAEFIMPVRRVIMPRAWLPCDGKPIDRREYPELFKLMVGSNFGPMVPKLPCHWIKTDFATTNIAPMGSIYMMMGDPI